jgi:hypothetical protein
MLRRSSGVIQSETCQEPHRSGITDCVCQLDRPVCSPLVAATAQGRCSPTRHECPAVCGQSVLRLHLRPWDR